MEQQQPDSICINLYMEHQHQQSSISSQAASISPCPQTAAPPAAARQHLYHHVHRQQQHQQQQPDSIYNTMCTDSSTTSQAAGHGSHCHLCLCTGGHAQQHTAYSPVQGNAHALQRACWLSQQEGLQRLLAQHGLEPQSWCWCSCPGGQQHGLPELQLSKELQPEGAAAGRGCRLGLAEHWWGLGLPGGDVWCQQEAAVLLQEGLALALVAAPLGFELLLGAPVLVRAVLLGRWGNALVALKSAGLWGDGVLLQLPLLRGQGRWHGAAGGLPWPSAAAAESK